MSLPSLHLMRGVVDIFLHKSASMEPVSETAPAVQDTDIDDDKAYQGAVRQIDSLGASYERDMLRVLGDILQDIIPMSEDPTESSFWGDKDVISLLHVLPRRMVEWMGKALGMKLAKALNASFGNYTYKLKGRKDDEGNRKDIATFSDADLHPEQAYRRFADILNEDSDKEWKWEDVREKYTYVKEPRQFYDENDLKVNASIKAQTALDEVVNMLSEHYLNSSTFSTKLVEKREGADPAVTWLRPPRGKTQSAMEQTSEHERRSMDPAVANYFFGKAQRAAETKKSEPVGWQYVTVEVAPGKEGESVALLTMAIPELGGKKYTVTVPNDVGVAMRDARQGENYTMDVLGYDPSKGFKVSLNDFRDRLILDKKKSMKSTGVTAKQLSSAIHSIIDDYAEKLVGSKAAENVSKAAESLLGNVIVDGKNIATNEGFKELIDMHEQRKTMKEQKGGVKKGEEPRDILKSFERRKQEIEEKRKTQEEDLGEDVAWVQHQLTDHKNKLSAKIADKLGRRAASNPPFTNNMNTWEYGPALMNKDGVRWLVELAMDEALDPTKSGKIQWRSLLAGILSSNVLADKVRTEKLFGKGTFEKVLPALKVVLVKHNKGIPDEEKRKTFEEFKRGTLAVSPEERAEIAKELSSKSVVTLLDNVVNRVNDGIAKLFLEMYYDGDPDAIGIVNASRARLPERMTKKDKEEWEVDPKKKKVTTSFRERVDEARAKVQDERTKNSEMARGLESLILSGDFAKASKELQSAKAGDEATSSLKSIEQAGVEDPSEEQLLAIEAISDAYESALNRKSDDKLKDVFKSIRTVKEVAPEETELSLEKQASLYSAIVKMSMSKIYA